MGLLRDRARRSRHLPSLRAPRPLVTATGADLFGVWVGMNSLHTLHRLARAAAISLLLLVPLVVAACSNGSGSGPGY